MLFFNNSLCEFALYYTQTNKHGNSFGSWSSHTTISLINFPIMPIESCLPTKHQHTHAKFPLSPCVFLSQMHARSTHARTYALCSFYLNLFISNKFKLKLFVWESILRAFWCISVRMLLLRYFVACVG